MEYDINELVPVATHQPFLEFYINKTSGDIIEFGVGDGSTGFILNLIKDTDRKLISVENNLEWYNKIKEKYPETEQHKYIFTDNWKETIATFNPSEFDIIFIDQAPWEARVWTLDHFKDTSKYIILHDANYYPHNNIFGNKDGQINFSDKFTSWALYTFSNFNDLRFPPTLVGSNVACKIYDIDCIKTKMNE